MKFIINSEYFRKKINEAIELQARFFETEGDSIYFLTRTSAVVVQAHPLEKSDEREPFEAEKWQRVAHELKKIPEQPITVELDYHRIEIYCVMSNDHFRIPVMPITDQLNKR